MKPLWLILILTVLPSVLPAQTAKLPLPMLPDSQRQVLTTYLQNHLMTPEDYVLSKFKDHDLVFIGEQHRIKENVQLIQRLIPLCYKKGIYSLGFEFARRVDQPLIDSLLNGSTYNESLANRILLQQFVFWGYQDYADVFRAAWQVNHELPSGARHFRVLALGNAPDWSAIKTEADRDKGPVMRAVWHGESEEDWAKVLLEEVVAKHEQALVFSGIHHAFTEYKQPKYDPRKQAFAGWGDKRMGNAVYEKIGKRAITIFLHAPWAPSSGYEADEVYPVDGVIDALMDTLGPVLYPVGFDTRGTPFGSLSGETSIYKWGYDHFKLQDYCDGYIFQMPISRYTGVTPIPNFVNAENLEYVRQNSPAPALRTATAEMINEGIARDADIPRRYAQFR